MVCERGLVPSAGSAPELDCAIGARGGGCVSVRRHCNSIRITGMISEDELLGPIVDVPHAHRLAIGHGNGPTAAETDDDLIHILQMSPQGTQELASARV